MRQCQLTAVVTGVVDGVGIVGIVGRVAIVGTATNFCLFTVITTFFEMVLLPPIPPPILPIPIECEYKICYQYIFICIVCTIYETILIL